MLLYFDEENNRNENASISIAFFIAEVKRIYSCYENKKVLELITFWWTEGLLNDPNVFKTNIYDFLNVYYRALLWDKVIER